MRRSLHGWRWVASALTFALVATACSDGDKPASTSPAATTTTETAESAAPPETSMPEEPAPPDTVLVEPDAATSAALEAALQANPEGCDALDTRSCLLPFPSDAYTRDDSSTDTGRRVNMAPNSATPNSTGVPVDLTEWNRNDGFSPNSTLMTFVPGLDESQSALPPWTDL